MGKVHLSEIIYSVELYRFNIGDLVHVHVHVHVMHNKARYSI